ncbi:MAG TPA: hypothetical protein VFB59_05825 [Candidatus Saccharimonadales bacterium]|nr:hypothetical protein [Candidatus Saccharimonadales bacterium]
MTESLYFAANVLQQPGIDPHYQAVCREVCVEALVKNFGTRKALTPEENYQAGLERLRLAAEADDSLIVLRPTVVASSVASVQEIYASLVRRFNPANEDVKED